MNHHQNIFGALYYQRVSKGFTLIELMITVTVLAVLVALAVPSFRDATLGTRLSSFANRFVASTYLAKSEAIKRNATLTMCVSTDGTNCVSGGWEKGWILKTGSTIIFREQALPDGFKISMSDSGGASIASITFKPSGLISAGSGTAKVCRAVPQPGNQEREITLQATGRAYVSTTNTSTCS
jgi:type IV fimbrial biogenesis protein FimT